MKDRWFDDAAGPVVRPYAMTRGRTRTRVGEVRLDLIALVIVDGQEGGAYDVHPVDGAADRGSGALGASGAPGVSGAELRDDRALHADRTLAPEHLDIVRLCRRSPLSVAEVAAELDLPVGVVRVLIGDLMDAELVRVSRPVPPAELPDESILREVIDGLRAL